MSETTSYAVIDDQSPLVTYVGEWFNVDLDEAWNNSLSTSSKKGATATVKFRGNRVSVVGAVSFTNATGAPISQYVLDDGSPSVHVPPVSKNNTLPVTFFLSPLLADSTHTLKITLINANAPFFLDYILYNASVADSTSASASGLRPTIITTVVAAPTNVAQAAAGGSSVAVGPIVGGVIGGVALLVSAVLAWYFLYWRRRGQGYHKTARDDYDVLGAEFKPAQGAYELSTAPPPAIVPYNAFTTSPRADQIGFQQQQNAPARSDTLFSAPSVYSVSSAAPSTQLSMYSVDSDAPPVPPLPVPYAPYAPSSSDSSSTAPSGSSGRTLSVVVGGLAVVGTTAPLSTPASRKAAEAARLRSQPPPGIQAVDSGQRFATAGPSTAVPEDAPPVYTEA